MWIIIPGQRLDEQETLTHHTLVQQKEERERGGDGSRSIRNVRRLLLNSAGLDLIRDVTFCSHQKLIIHKVSPFLPKSTFQSIVFKWEKKCHLTSKKLGLFN